MADSATPVRLEPSVGPVPVTSSPAAELRAAVEQPPPEAQNSRSGLDQLSRIEDKTARIEEKYARSEALLHRVENTVEAATGRMREVASQSDLLEVRSQVSAIAYQVRSLPGKTALVAVAIVTSLLTAAIVLALLKYGILGAPPR
jgi:hypothetical protein